MAKEKKISGKTTRTTSAQKKTGGSSARLKKVEKKAKKGGSIQLDVYDTKGKKSGSIKVPKEIFSEKINSQALAQSIRVYQTNQRSWPASVKSRGEVRGSTRKIYRQKGTGRARHGGIRAPIFVGGGVAMGPEKRKKRLTIPKKMKKIAMSSALTTKLKEKKLSVVEGLDTLEPKTKQFAKCISNLSLEGKVLIIRSSKEEHVVRGVSNIQQVDQTRIESMHPYMIMSHRHIVYTKQAMNDFIDSL